MLIAVALSILFGAMLIGALVTFARWKANPDSEISGSYKWAALTPIALVMTPTIAIFYKATYRCHPHCDGMTGPITLVAGFGLSVFVAAASVVGAFLAIERLSR